MVTSAQKKGFSSVAQSCPTLCNPMGCSTPGFHVHHQRLELAQAHVHRVSDAIQPSHPLILWLRNCNSVFKRKEKLPVEIYDQRIEGKVHKNCISMQYTYTFPTSCSLVTGLWWQRCPESPKSAVKCNVNPCHCSVYFFQRPQIIILMVSIL